MILLGIEIERKWLVGRCVPPEFNFLGESKIDRQYISVEPEIRLSRRTASTGKRSFNLTFKSDGHLQRNEVRIIITEPEYTQLKDFCPYDPLRIEMLTYLTPEKRRLTLKHCINTGLTFAEIEFLSREDSTLFDASKYPVFFMKEVTGDASYYMKNIWKRYVKELDHESRG